MINLMPGTYNGVKNSNLTVTVNNLTITSYNGPVVFTPAADSAPTRYFDITGKNVVLDGLTFISGVSMSHEDTAGGEVKIAAENVLVNNTKFINSVSQAGALYVTAENTVIKNSIFDNSTVNAGDGGGAHVESKNLTVINSLFNANHVNNGAGAGIYFIGENLLVDTSNFTSNYVSARKGGAIYAEASNTKIINSKFFNQTASSADGGAVYITGKNLVVNNSTFDKNTVNGAVGGAIYFIGDNLSVNKSKFTNNVVQGKNAASIYSEVSNLALLNNSYFDSNNAWNGAGGAIYNKGKMLVVDNSTFTNQITTSPNGAGVIYMNGSLNVTNSNFTKNYGYAGVGAVHQLNGDLYINNTLFDSNQGWNLNAGAVYTENSNFLIENSNFTANTAGNSGGAVYADNSNGTVQDNIFDKNQANNGAGSLHLIGNNYTVQRNNFSNGPRYSVGFIIFRGDNNTVDNCNFEHGYSQNSIGGAIASYGENLKVTNCDMNDIDTPSVGGMIYSKGNNTFIENCNLNDSETVYGVIFIEGDNPVINNITMSNARSNIGAIHLRSNNVTITNSTFDKCQKSSYGNGGVIFWTGTTFGAALSLDSLTVDNCTFIECNGEGGYNTAVTAFGNNVLINNSDFIRCYSPYCGAITFRGTNATIVNSNFDGCEARVYAGAISMAGTNVTVEDCNFTNNWAMMYGGAIYSTASNSIIKNNMFVNNTVGSDGTKHVLGSNYPISYYPGDGGSVMIMSGNNMSIVNNTMCNASMTGSGGAIENRANSRVFSSNNISNINVTIGGGGIMNYGNLDDRSTIIDCHAGQHGNDIYNLGMEGPVYMILDQKPRYLYVGEKTFIPIGLVNEHGATVTVPQLQGLIDDGSGRSTYIQFEYNEAEDNSGINTSFNQAGVYVFRPLTQQANVFLAQDNILTIYVVDRMPVEITLPDVTAYPQDIVDYTFNITNPNGLLIRNGTVWMEINNHNYTAEILNGKVNIKDHDLSGKTADVMYSEDYNGNITFRNVLLYDDAKIHNVTAHYVSNCKYYLDSEQNGTIEILSFATDIPEIRIDAYVRDQVTFSIDVKSENGRTVDGNVSFYLPNVLASNLVSDHILNSSKFEGYDGFLFTVELRKNLTLTIPVESEFRLPIFYYGNKVFAASQGLLNISSHRNPTQVLAPVIHTEVDQPFDILINVTSKYTVDENTVIIIFGGAYSQFNGENVVLPTNSYGIPIKEGSVINTTRLSMPGIYSYPVIYTGGPSFLGSSSVTVIIVAMVNVTVAADDIVSFPGDIKNITVNLIDKYGKNVSNGTVNTTINGEIYFADVVNGTATFVNVLLDETETEYDFTVSYKGNNYYNDANTTAHIKLVKINTDVTADDIEGLPDDNKVLNITLKDEDGNILNSTVKVKYPNGTVDNVDLTGNNTFTLPNPGFYEIEVNYTGSIKYNPSNCTIKVLVSPLNTITAGNNMTGYPKQTVNITISITDERGNPVRNGTAAFVLGNEYHSEVINGHATFESVELPQNEGKYAVTVAYNDNDGYYYPSQTVINITVVKINTNVSADNIKGRTGEKVNVTANITDIYGNAIENGTATLTINGTVYTANITDGSVTFENVVLPNPDNYTADIKYPGSYVYNKSNTPIDVTVLKLDTNINADNVTGLPNDVVNITADVTDENGKPVSDGTAIIVIDEKEYSAEVVNGLATFEDVVLPNPGNYTVPIKYNGSEIYNPSVNSIVIDVLKVDTNISADSVNGKPGDKVNVTANVSDADGNAILNGTATLTVEGINYTANVSDGSVTFEGVVLPNPGNYTANITYHGDDYYNPSNTTVDISVSKVDSNITSHDISGHPGDKVNVTANVSDADGNAVPNGTATLTVDGVDYIGNVSDGVVTFEDVILPKEGNYSAPIRFNGTDIYNPSNTTVDISVSKIESIINSTPVNTNPNENFTVVANVSDVDGNPILNGTATLTVNGTNYTAPIIDGTVTFENVTLKEGNYTGVISYPGDDYYNPSSTQVNIAVSKLDTAIDSDDVYGYPYEIVDITANVTDENGNPVLNGTAVLTIGEKIGEAPNGLAAAGEYVANVKDGKAVFEGITLPAPGVYQTYLMYLGDDVYNPSNSTMRINVLKHDSKVAADNVSCEPDNLVNVTANVTDSEGNPIENGTAILTINGTNYTASIVNGTVTFENIDLPAGNYTGVIVYPGDDYYNPSNTTVNVDIKVSTIIPVDSVTVLVTSNKSDIEITITDNDGNPILNGTASLIVYGVEYTAEVNNGTAKFIDVYVPYGNVIASVKYHGNQYYAPSESTFEFNIGDEYSLENQTIPEEETDLPEDTNLTNETVSDETEIPEDTDQKDDEEIDVKDDENHSSDLKPDNHKSVSKQTVNHMSVSKQTGNPILVVLMVLMCLISNTILRRKI